MKTRIDIDDVLMGEAMAITATTSKKETIELALKELIQQKKRQEMQIFSERLSWDGDSNRNKMDWFG